MSVKQHGALIKDVENKPNWFLRKTILCSAFTMTTLILSTSHGFVNIILFYTQIIIQKKLEIPYGIVYKKNIIKIYKAAIKTF